MTCPLTNYVAKHPGQSVDQIGKALGQKTKELALPIIRMIEAKKLSTKEKRRRRPYLAGGAIAKAAPATNA